MLFFSIFNKEYLLAYYKKYSYYCIWENISIYISYSNEYMSMNVVNDHYSVLQNI